MSLSWSHGRRRERGGGAGGAGGSCSGAARRGGGECDVWVAGTLVEIKVKISASSPIFIYKVWLTEMIVISLNH